MSGPSGFVVEPLAVPVISESETPPQSSPASHDISIPEVAALRILEHDPHVPAAGDPVTLVVHGWHNVQPGTLHWHFPDKESAVKAARALRNATKWAILAGRDRDVEAARARGLVLVEQA